MTAPAILSLTGAGEKTIDGRSLTIANGTTLRIAGSGNFRLDNAATVTNNGTFDFQSDAGIRYAAGAVPTFTTAGTLRSPPARGRR